MSQSSHPALDDALASAVTTLAQCRALHGVDSFQAKDAQAVVEFLETLQQGVTQPLRVAMELDAWRSRLVGLTQGPETNDPDVAAAQIRGRLRRGRACEVGLRELLRAVKSASASARAQLVEAADTAQRVLDGYDPEPKNEGGA